MFNNHRLILGLMATSNLEQDKFGDLQNIGGLYKGWNEIVLSK
jgi:hypothetical protein